MMYCKYCGQEMPEDSIFCRKCGKKIIEADLAAQETSIITLIVRRPKTTGYSRRSVALYIDGEHKSDLKNGDEWSGEVPEGKHTIAIISNWRVPDTASFQIRGNDAAKIDISFSPWDGSAIFTFLGSAKTTSSNLSPQNNNPQTISDPSQQNQNNQTINVRHSYSGLGCLWIILDVIIFFAIIYFLAPGFAKGFNVGFRWGLDHGKDHIAIILRPDH